MKTVATPSIEAQILETVVAPDEPSLSAPLARALLKLSFNERQRAEIDALLDRNNEGAITTAQRERLEAYVRIGNLLSLLQAKARATLSRKSGK